MTKKLATIVVTTMDGATFTVTDTEDCNLASTVLASLQYHSGAYVSVGDDTYWIPSTAVANIKVSYAEGSEITPSEPC